MNYLSVCSGVEAFGPAWHNLGFRSVGVSEIDKHASAVLRYHFPNTPNYGDFTTITPESIGATVDLLCGGTPCQDFSVAGLRAGLAGERGNLTLEFVRLVQRVKPRWIIWENVPGVLSDNGGKSFAQFLDNLEEIGYICDVEILDAQFFGVPQRRRRVFVCAQSREDLLSQTTPSSALTISQCLLEILAAILAAQSTKSGSEQAESERLNRLSDGATRRMRLFGIASEKCNFLRLRQILADSFLRFQPVVKNWDLEHGESQVQGVTLEDLLMGSPTAVQFTLTEQSLNDALADLCEVMKSCITSTTIKTITPTQTFMCLRAGLLIGRLICRLSGSSPVSWSAGLSFLTLHQELTSYARQASRDLFSQLGGLYAWSDLVREATHTEQVVGYLGDARPAAAVLFDPESLSGYPASGRESGQDIAGTLTAGVSVGGRSWGADEAAAGHIVVGAVKARTRPATLASTLNAHFGDKLGLENQHINEGAPLFVPYPFAFDKSHVTNPKNRSRCEPGSQCHTLHSGATHYVGFQTNQHNATTITNTGEMLRSLRAAVGEEAFSEWCLGRLDTIRSSQILRQEMHGGWIRREASKEGSRVGDCSLPRPQSLSDGSMCAMREAGRLGCTPQEWRLAGQLANQLGAHLSELSQQRASVEEALLGMWQASEGLGLLREALSAVQEIRQPATEQDQSARPHPVVRRLTPIETERLMGYPENFTRYATDEKGRTYEVADTARYKMCGNGWATPVAVWVAARLMAVEQMINELSQC